MTLEELNKNRSYGGCIKASYKAMADNLKELFRKTWTVALTYAAAGALMGTTAMCFHSTPQLPALSALPFIIATLLLFAKICAIVNGKSMGWNLRRAITSHIVAYIALLAITAVALMVMYGIFYALMTQGKHNADLPMIMSLTTLAAVGIATIIIILPLSYAIIKYQFNPELRLRKMFGKAVNTGFRHWGLMFAVTVIIGMITLIIQLILFSPCNILITASVLSAYGQSVGDPSGLPSYFPALAFVSSLLAYFCMAFLFMWLIFGIYYTYGTIETRENERLKAKNLIYRP